MTLRVVVYRAVNIGNYHTTSELKRLSQHAG